MLRCGGGIDRSADGASRALSMLEVDRHGLTSRPQAVATIIENTRRPRWVEYAGGGAGGGAGRD